jgi:5-methylcytosine-specific restriction endonuclease McrA
MYEKTPIFNDEGIYFEKNYPHPDGLEICNPLQRTFPLSWKEEYFRMKFSDESGGYICPICNRVFSGTRGFSQLRADHIYPFSKGGLTIWENLQLLCAQCNSQKSNNLVTEE